MKKLYTTLLSCTLCFSLLTACAGNQTGGSNDVKGQDAATETTQQTVQQDQDSEVSAREDGADISSGAEQSVDLRPYIGEWYDKTSQRAMMTIVPSAEYGDAWVTIHWGSSAWEAVEWSLPVIVREDGSLFYANGEKVLVSYEETDELTNETREVLRSDLEGTFTFDADGNLLWTDEKEEDSTGCVFEPYQPDLPTQDAWVNQYFHAVSGYEKGVAGSSLSEAQAACAVFGFASEYQLWTAEIPAMRDSMLAAWEDMSEEERGKFDANFINVVRLIDRCLSDYDGSRGVFDDAGVGDKMEALLRSETARLSWTTLCSNTLTMGNSGDDAEGGITEEMAYEGVYNYCHDTYDWSITEDNPSVMYLTMGEESETEYQVIFRSYTGSFVYFYVDKSDGTTRMTEYVPTLDVETETGSISLYNYLNTQG